jgi:hypothetical protein
MTEATDRHHAGEIDGRDFYPILARLRKDHDQAEREHARLMRRFDAFE